MKVQIYYNKIQARPEINDIFIYMTPLDQTIYRVMKIFINKNEIANRCTVGSDHPPKQLDIVLSRNGWTFPHTDKKERFMIQWIPCGMIYIGCIPASVLSPSVAW